VPFGHSSGGHEQEGEYWAKINGMSGHANPLSGTGSHRARGEDHIAATSSGQSPSMMMVAIVRRCIVSFLRFWADAVIRYAKGTDQRLGSTVVTHSDKAPGNPDED
jgi:hypothetical protein